MSFGGEHAIRSIVKSCLSLWCLKVGNEELKGGNYAAARRFTTDGSEDFLRDSVKIDTRLLPQSEFLKQDYSQMFNSIYVSSDNNGKVFGYFTLYNLVSWVVQLCQEKGTPNTRANLVSNPHNNAKWSDKVTDNFLIDISWFEAPEVDYEIYGERLRAGLDEYYANARSNKVKEVITEVFDNAKKNGEEVLTEEMIAEISNRVTYWMFGLRLERSIGVEDLEIFMGKIKKSGS